MRGGGARGVPEREVRSQKSEEENTTPWVRTSSDFCLLTSDFCLLTSLFSSLHRRPDRYRAEPVPHAFPDLHRANLTKTGEDFFSREHIFEEF
jgi:hypothetical protein